MTKWDFDRLMDVWISGLFRVVPVGLLIAILYIFVSRTSNHSCSFGSDRCAIFYRETMNQEQHDIDDGAFQVIEKHKNGRLKSTVTVFKVDGIDKFEDDVIVLVEKKGQLSSYLERIDGGSD